MGSVAIVVFWQVFLVWWNWKLYTAVRWVCEFSCGALEWIPVGWDKSSSTANWIPWPVGATSSVLQGFALGLPWKQKCSPPRAECWLMSGQFPAPSLSDLQWLSPAGFSSGPYQLRLECSSQELSHGTGAAGCPLWVLISYGRKYCADLGEGWWQWNCFC